MVLGGRVVVERKEMNNKGGWDRSSGRGGVSRRRSFQSSRGQSTCFARHGEQRYYRTVRWVRNECVPLMMQYARYISTWPAPSVSSDPYMMQLPLY